MNLEREILSELGLLQKITINTYEPDTLIYSALKFNNLLDLFSCYISIKAGYMSLDGGNVSITEKGKLLLDESKKVVTTRDSYYLAFSYFGPYIYKNDFIYSFMKIARSIRNHFAHSELTWDEKVDLIEKYYFSLFSVIIWFVDEIFDLSNLNINKSELISEINKTKFYYVKVINKIRFGSDDVYVRSLENKILELENKVTYYEMMQNNVNSLCEFLGRIDKNVLCLIKGQETIIGKLDNLSTFISEEKEIISSKLELYLNNKDYEKYENIIEEYILKISNKILEKYGSNKTEAYRSEEKKLLALFGEDNWKKLNINSRNFLVTAKVLFEEMSAMEKADYSGVCLLLTKAVENELHIRFYTNFLNYLRHTYPDAEWPSFFTKTDFRGKQLIKDYDFTLGSIKYFCCKGKKYDAYDLEILNAYCKDELLIEFDTAEAIDRQLTFISNTAEEIRIRFRNPSAHINSVNEIVAIECLEYILDVSKVLIKYMHIFK